jgi:hypothetical protein
MSKNNLPLDGKASLCEKIAQDYESYIDLGMTLCPTNPTYKIIAREENLGIKLEARLAAFKSFDSPAPIIKQAFDTRRVNQETDRNPRQNLQYWHRADAFIDKEDEGKLTIFANLMSILNDIKTDFGTQPEWFESYSRILYDNVHRILRIKQADLDIFKPQLSYLEQLVFARYRLSMEDLSKFSKEDIRAKLLSKDEALLKRGNYLNETGITKGSAVENKNIVIDGSKTTQESLIQALFGGGAIRKDGEKNVSRTITITISDNVLD